jgi:hypothetical protein
MKQGDHHYSQDPPRGVWHIPAVKGNGYNGASPCRGVVRITVETASAIKRSKDEGRRFLQWEKPLRGPRECGFKTGSIEPSIGKNWALNYTRFRFR